jgi:hypothetical protein
VAIILVMVQSTVAWVFFRAATFNDALVIIRNMLWVNTNVDFKIPQDVRNGFYFVLIMFVIEYIFVSIKLRKLIRNKKLYRTIEVILVALLITITIFLRGKGHEFIYFQF